jgi:hypothetical protein
MIAVPITALRDDSLCLIWLERYLHPNGLRCPHCGSTARRLCRDQGHLPAYRGRGCDGYDTLLTGTSFETTRQRPALLVLVLRGMAKGEPTARLARELGLAQKQLPTLRRRLQAHLHDTAPTAVMTGTACEADELDQNAGGRKALPILTPRIHPGGVPTSGKATGATPMIAHPAAVWCRETRASAASGAATTRPNAPVMS